MKNSYLFLGFAIPNEEIIKDFTKDENPAIQTHKFNWNLIRALESTNLLDIVYISSRPVTDYPFNKKRYYKSKSWNVDIENEATVSIHEIGFINTPIRKLISRFLTGFSTSLNKLMKIRNKKGIIIYSVHLPYMLIGYILSRIFRIELVGIWTDPPAVSNSKDSFLKSKLRNFEYKFSKYLMKKFTKVIPLTKYLALDFSPGTPYLVIEGIINSEEINEKKIYTKNNPIKVVYTGSISKKYGVENLVNAFKNMNKSHIELDIYGLGDFQEELKEITQKYKNINYKGFLPNNEILEIQRNADFLINTRSSGADFVKYSFPSKTLEYMTSGTPVISTMLPGIPTEYSNYLITLKDNDISSIEEVLTEIITWDEKRIEVFGKNSKGFSATKSYQRQGLKIVEFLNKEY